MSAFPWYREVGAAAPLTQGDILEDVPILRFKAEDTEREVTQTTGASVATETRLPEVQVEYVRAVVMTQACDLAESKVRYVHLCPVFKATELRELLSEKKKFSDRDWNAFLQEINKGRKWNMTLLERPPSQLDDVLVVDFHEVLSVPTQFLRLFVSNSGNRIQLLPPYREHLSQAFARYFMRVGLPENIALPK